MSLGRWYEAVGIYRKSVELEPHSLEAQDHLGFVLAQLGQSEEAIAAYFKALAIDPNSEVVNFHLLGVLQGSNLSVSSNKNLQEIEQCYRRIIAFNPNHLEVYRKLLELQPNDLDVYLQYGQALINQDQWQDAISTYQIVIQRQPNAVAYQGLGDAWQGQAIFDQAIQAYRKALEFNSECSLIYNNLGDALAKFGQIKEASVCYRRALELAAKQQTLVV